MHGCNSCKYLDEKSKKPGRTSGGEYFCQMRKGYVNCAKDDCDSYEEDLSRSTAVKNELYRDGLDYNDSINKNGCNSCANLDFKARKPGKSGGALYFCKKKETYVNCAKDNCEYYENGILETYEKNKAYDDGMKYDDDAGSVESYMYILIIIIVVGILLTIFT